MAGADEDEKRREERPRKVVRQQPGPAKNPGDETANPLPDDFNEHDENGGGDPSRS